MQNMGFMTPQAIEQNRLQKQVFFQNLVMSGNADRLRKQAIEAAKKEQKKLQDKANRGGVAGAVLGAIGGGLTGFVTGGFGGAVIGGFRGAMSGYQTGRETGDAGQGALIGAATGGFAGMKEKQRAESEAFTRELQEKQMSLLEAAQETKELEAGTKAAKAILESQEKEQESQRLLTEQAQKLRKEFSAEKIIEDANEINAGVNKIQSLWKDYVQNPKKKLIAMDQALITIFNKILDPGSVVRESEYERIPGAAAALDRIPGFIEKLSKGGAGLTPETKAEIVRSAAILSNAHNVLAKQKSDFFAQEASLSGIDPNRVINVFKPLTGLDQLIDQLNSFTQQTNQGTETKEQRRSLFQRRSDEDKERRSIESNILNMLD